VVYEDQLRGIVGGRQIRRDDGGDRHSDRADDVDGEAENRRGADCRQSVRPSPSSAVPIRYLEALARRDRQD
jgi:hypothetical protein